MKKEQILDMIGEAPDTYVKETGEFKKRPVSRKIRWVGGIAAVLAAVILFHNMPAIPLIVSAKAVSTASQSRKTERPDYDSPAYDTWRAEREHRDELVEEARTPIAAFVALASEEVLSGADDENRVWSPINAYISLAMTAELTEGETREELLAVLGASDTNELRSRVSAVWEQIYEDNGKEISVLANSLWLDNALTYDEERMDILAHDYYASVYQGDLGSEKTNRAITNWMRNQTGGMLKDRTGKTNLPEADQMLVMASTIYFQSRWGDEFSAKNNTQSVFHAASGDVEATFMNKKEYEMNYYWDEDYGAVQMFLENGSCMWFILPDEDKTVDDILESDAYMKMITQEHLRSEEETNRKWMKVNLSVPQFDVSASIDVKKGLQNMGLTKVFDWTQNGFASSLQSRTSEYPVYLDSIHQDTRVKIDEKGVTAASYIELNFGAGAAEPPDEIIDFVLDRPFVFAVTKSHIPLFVGKVNIP